MSLLEETKRLLRAYRISPNRSLGQNFMIEASVFELLSAYAQLDVKDVVVDVGAGFGFLTRFLAERVSQVIAVEKDVKLMSVLRSRLEGYTNVTLIEGDLFKKDVPLFSKVVSIPPYQISSRLIMWLFKHSFDRAVLIVQKEFAKRLVAEVGTDDYGWVTVATFYHIDCQFLDSVPKSSFYPQPKVDSVIICLSPKKNHPFVVADVDDFVDFVRMLFTQRNRKVRNAVQTYLKSTRKLAGKRAVNIADSLDLRLKRVRELSPENFGALSNELAIKTSIL